MPYIVSLVPRSPYSPWVDVPGYVTGTFSKPITVDGELIVSVLNSGIPLDPEKVPHRYIVQAKAEALPEIFGLKFGYAVIDRFREKVEELEPTVHQFFDVEIMTKGGARPDKRYWLLQICNRVSSIDPEKTTLPLGPGDRYVGTNIPSGQPMGMVLRKEAIAGKRMWFDRKFMGRFFSDELFDFVRVNKMTRFDAWKIEAE